jgi:hypothetical protein
VLEKYDTYAFFELIKQLTVARRSAQVSVDFVEEEVRGRIDNQVVLIDDDFVSGKHPEGEDNYC